MSKNLTLFKQLHKESTPLLLGNVWDAHSAKIAEKTGYKALGSSSHAIAFSLGYEDGEKIPFEELFFVVKRIIESVKIPVSVDFEAGYSSDPKQVAKYVKKLVDIGVVGINLEDGIVKNGKRELGSSKLLSDKIEAIKSNTDVFINARTDTFTTKHPQALEEAIARSKEYGDAGADGFFVPLIEKEEDITEFVNNIKLPLNVFTTPNLPDYEKLGKLGVKRISHGAKQYDQLMRKSEEIFTDFLESKNYKVVLG